MCPTVPNVVETRWAIRYLLSAIRHPLSLSAIRHPLSAIRDLLYQARVNRKALKRRLAW